MEKYYDRSASAIIKEAELLNAPIDYVRTFFESKSDDSKNIHLDDLDAITELNLLKSGNEFMRLTLAQYCLYSETISTIFENANNENNEPLKLACLKNRSIGRATRSYSQFPMALFNDDKEKLIQWLKTSTNKEIIEIFKNDTLDREFLTDILDTQSKMWSCLNEEKQRLLLLSLTKNRNISEAYEGPMDGHAEYLYYELNRKLWNLAKTAPVTSSWAYALGVILEKTRDIGNDFDSIEVAKRWIATNEQNEKDSARGDFSPYVDVRRSIYRPYIKGLFDKDISNIDHLDHPDIAYRECVYQNLKTLAVEDLRFAYDKDKANAVSCLLDNLNIWKKPDLREALNQLCWEIDENSDDVPVSYTSRYNLIEENLANKYPTWFEKRDDSHLSDDDERALTLGQARMLTKEYIDDISSAMHQLQKRLDTNNKMTEWTIYGIILVFLVLIMR
jgi:hypothetical protein